MFAGQWKILYTRNNCLCMDVSALQVGPHLLCYAYILIYSAACCLFEADLQNSIAGILPRTEGLDLHILLHFAHTAVFTHSVL